MDANYFSLAVTLTVVICSFTFGMAGIYLNYKYPKTEREREVLAFQNLQNQVATWRARAEACESLVWRTMQAQSGGVSIQNSDVTINRDLVGGDTNKRDDHV